MLLIEELVAYIFQEKGAYHCHARTTGEALDLVKGEKEERGEILDQSLYWGFQESVYRKGKAGHKFRIR